MSTTIKDIAARAEVSIATVSLVLNNKPGVGQTTRGRILKIADDLKYHQRGGVANVHRGTIRFLKIARHGHTVNRDRAFHDAMQFLGDPAATFPMILHDKAAPIPLDRSIGAVIR